MASETDRIEKTLVLRAPRARVWQALVDSKQFGTWFGMKIGAPFVAGKPVTGTITPTAVDAEIAKMQQPFDGLPFELSIERIDPERLFSFRWHPNAIERGVDYSKEPTTLVEFHLEETKGGVRLTVSESGFDRIPLERRAKAFASNDSGWGMVVKLLEKYLAQSL